MTAGFGSAVDMVYRHWLDFAVADGVTNSINPARNAPKACKAVVICFLGLGYGAQDSASTINAGIIATPPSLSTIQ